MRTMIVVVLGVIGRAAQACGPFLPDDFLTHGDRVLIESPRAEFISELIAITGANPEQWNDPSGFKNGSDEVVTADLDELSSALADSPLTGPERFAVLKAYQWRRAWIRESGGTPRPELPARTPREFQLYIEGAEAWYHGAIDSARKSWTDLLALPAAERQHRSLWAAYMLGRTYAVGQPESSAWFQHVLQLERDGFSDVLDLTREAIGWEARNALTQRDWVRAIHLYLEQLRRGDGSAALSIQLTCRRLMGFSISFDQSIQNRPPDRETLQTLLRDNEARPIITAYLLSFYSPDPFGGDLNSKPTLLLEWLTLLEQSGLIELREAERAAHAAYTAGSFELAARWLDLAPQDAAMANWIRAKLALRAGEVTRAQRLLEAAVARERPKSAPPTQGADDLYWLTRQDSVEGELATVQTSQQQFLEAFDRFQRAGHWQDAAYLADRVLDLDALKRYVDDRWPMPPVLEREPWSPDNDYWDGVLLAGDIDDKTQAYFVRWLLARRLARSGHPDEGLGYYPKTLQPIAQRCTAALNRGHDAKHKPLVRGRALWEAAKLIRRYGLELFGTESLPDWAMLGGQFDLQAEVLVRLGASDCQAGGYYCPEFQILPVSAEEKQRALASAPIPDRRWHYRYRAAELGWDAAALMPNQSEETATVLAAAGRWLSTLDPQGADRYYKALVRRCGKTALGREADRRRWFPP